MFRCFLCYLILFVLVILFSSSDSELDINNVYRDILLLLNIDTLVLFKINKKIQQIKKYWNNKDLFSRESENINLKTRN